MNLDRFITAQRNDFHIALTEIKRGTKINHWMWYIFPQIYGLGNSTTSNYYAIKSVEEAIMYLNNKYLYNNIITICTELLKLDINDPKIIFGNIDALKLHSSMTLFDYICSSYFEKLLLENDSKLYKIYSNIPKNEIFNKVLLKFYDGKKDFKTIKIICSEIEKNYI